MNHQEFFQALLIQENADHAGKVKAYETMLNLVDPATGRIPEDIIKAFSRTKLDLPNGSKGFANAEELILSMMENQDAKRNWTSRSVHDALIAQGERINISEQVAINTISSVLIRLTKEGKFTRIELGKGRRPSIYRWNA